jgi:hypothetical protein
MSSSARAHPLPLLAIASCMKILLLTLCLIATLQAAAQAVVDSPYTPPKESAPSRLPLSTGTHSCPLPPRPTITSHRRRARYSVQNRKRTAQRAVLFK